MKITENQFIKFQVDYIVSNPFNQRYSQYFCNYFNIVDPILFYETDRSIATIKIIQNYLDID